MNAFLGSLRVACGPAVENDGFITSQKLLVALNTLVSNPSSSLQMSDLEALFKITGMTPIGDDNKIESEQFLKRIASLFAPALSGADADDVNPFDVLIAYRELFVRIDSDQDGRLYPDQLHELVRGLTRMESSGISRSPDLASTEMIVAHLDKAKKGYVDFNDFLSGALLSTDPNHGSSSSATSVSLSNSSNSGLRGSSTHENGDEDGEFLSAIGPPSSSSSREHETIFDDQLELDFKPSTSTSRPPNASLESRDSASLSQLKSHVHILEQRLGTATSELEKSELARSELLSRLNEQDRQIEAFKKQTKLVAEMEQDRNRWSDEMEQLRADLHITKDQLKASSKAEAELTAERDRLRDDLFQKGKEINDIEDQMRLLKDAAAGSQDEKSQLAALQAELQAQKERYEALNASKLEQEKAHAKLVEALNELQAKHEVTLMEVEDAKRRLSDLKDEKVAMTSTPARTKGGNLKAELSSAMRPMSPSKYSVASSDGLSGSLPGQPDFGGASSSLGSSSIASPSSPSGNSSEELMQLKIELDMLQKEKKALLAHLSSADARSAALEKDKAELSSRISSLTSDASSADKAKGSLQRQLDEANAELDDVRGMLAAAQDSVNVANAAAAKATASAFVRPEMSASESELEELRVLRLSRRELEEQVAKLRQQIDGDSIQLKALRNEIQQLRELNRSLKARIAQFPEEPVPLSTDEDMRRGLIGNSRVTRHDQGCCDACTIM